jgi:hypothetical protein
MDPKPTWMAILSMLTSCAAPATVSRAHRDAGPEPASPPAEDPLFDTTCESRQYCRDIDVENPDLDFGAEIGLVDCTAYKGASLRGSWPVEGTTAQFEWQAEARVNSVFPTLGPMVTYLGCAQRHPEVHSPEVLIARNPDGLDWARLEGDDVFIPLSGSATLDRVFHATAVLDARDGASEPRVTVSIEEPPLARPPARHPDLGRGDGFSWGYHRATVIRIVPTQERALGAIGWVEINLSDGT